MLGWREVAPAMASQLEGPGRGLNLLHGRALAVATLLQAQVIMAGGQRESLLRSALQQAGLS